MMRQSLVDGFHETRNLRESIFDREVDEIKRS
jgi:hypothetical protein